MFHKKKPLKATPNNTPRVFTSTPVVTDSLQTGDMLVSSNTLQMWGVTGITANASTSTQATSVATATPVNAVAATLTTALTGANNDLTFTAVTKGTAGQNITVAYVNAGATQTLACTVTGTAISVNLATNGSSVITTIASDISTLIAATPAAAALVTVANYTGNNGAGLVTAMTATPLASGVDGTVGIAGQVVFDASYLYVATAANTISGANWRRLTVGSVY